MGDESGHAKDKRLEFENNLIAFLSDLRRYVSSWIDNQSDVDDVVSEVILRAWCYMDDRRWRPVIENFQAFMIAIARNLRNDFWSKRKKEGLESLEGKDADERPRELEQSYDLAAIIEMRIYLEELGRNLPLSVIFQGLSDYELRVLYMHEGEGMTLAEIAEEEGVDRDTLRYQLIKIGAKIRYRARRYLEATGEEYLF